MFRARPFPRFRTLTALLLAGAAAVSAAPSQPASAASGLAVAMNVVSVTALNASTCSSATPNVTSFGAVLPGSSSVTTADCIVQFGSPNDSAQLRAFQTDECGNTAHPCSSAMDRLAVTPVAGVGATADMYDGIALPGSRVWLVGLASNVRYSADGGTTWSNRNTGVNAPLEAIDHVSGGPGAEILVASARSGVVRRSTNGGVSWSGVSGLSGTDALDDIQVHESGVGWTVGWNRSAFRTTDGGATWTDVGAALAPCAASTVELEAVEVISPTEAWIVGSNGVVCHTTNGTTWSSVTVSPGTKLSAIEASADGEVIWIAGYDDVVRLSTDGGATWSSRPTGIGRPLRAMYAVDAQTAWVAGGDGLIAATTNGGLAWTILRHAPGSDDHFAGMMGTGSSVWVFGDPVDDLSLRVVSTVGAAVSNYTNTGAAGDRDWSSAATTNMFGVCLRALSQGAATNGTTWSADAESTADEPAVSADCGDGDADPWRSLPMNGSTGAKVAVAPAGDEDARAHLRFGLRTAAGQAPGTYLAPVSLEVLAPA